MVGGFNKTLKIDSKLDLTFTLVIYENHSQTIKHSVKPFFNPKSKRVSIESFILNLISNSLLLNGPYKF